MQALTALGRPLSVALLATAISAPALAAEDYSILSPGSIFLRSNQIGTGDRHSPLIGVIGASDATEANRLEITAESAAKVDGTHKTQPVSFADNFIVNTELPAAAALTDDAANPTVPFVGGFMMRWDGATWDRHDGKFLPPASAPTATQYIAVRCSDGTVFESCGGAGGGGGTSSNYGSAFPAAGTAAGFSDGTNMRPGRAVDADTGAGSVFVQQNMLVKSASGGPVELGTSTDPVRTDPTGTTTQPVGGTAAEDAAVTGNPNQIAGRASIDEPTAMSADGDVVRTWHTRFGQPVVLIGHGDPELPVYVRASVVGNNTIIVAPGGTNKICIQKGSVHNADTADVDIAFQDGAGGTTFWRARIGANAGGTLFDFGSRGWCLSDNTLLNASLSNGTGYEVDVNVTEWYVADLP